MGSCLKVIFIYPFQLVGGILWNIIQLIPYFLALFLVLLLFFNMGWIGFNPLGGYNPFGLFNPTPTLTRPSNNAPADNTADNETFQLVFRFEAHGDQLFYMGNAVDAEYARELARQAKGLDAKIEVHMASDVTVAQADSIREILNEAGVPYEIIPLE
jgi:hypothetical protein